MTGGLGGGGKTALPAESPNPALRRTEAARALARCFAKVVGRVDEDGGMGKKGAAVVAQQEKRRVEVLEVFLRRVEV